MDLSFSLELLWWFYFEILNIFLFLYCIVMLLLPSQCVCSYFLDMDWKLASTLGTQKYGNDKCFVVPLFLSISLFCMANAARLPRKFFTFKVFPACPVIVICYISVFFNYQWGCCLAVKWKCLGLTIDSYISWFWFRSTICPGLANTQFL